MEEKRIAFVAYQCKRIEIKISYLCVSSFLCGFRADLWPFKWVLLEPVCSLYNRYRSEAVDRIRYRKTAINSLQRLQSPPYSAFILEDSSTFHS